MVFVPGGYFLQGIDEQALEALVELCIDHADDPAGCARERLLEHHRNETPQRRVHVDAFQIDRTEVINAAYGACVAAGGCWPIDQSTCTFFRDGEQIAGGELDAPARADRAPVVCVTWEQAAAYCSWAGKRLPSEAEWEKAARGEDGRRFPWGDVWEPNAANWYDNEAGSLDGYPTVAPAGSFPSGASPHGALDMAGNVWEWVADGESGDQRIMRGGGHAAKPIALRTTKRVLREPKGWENVGFRCARSP
jgi:formylglycine-generating enzyme required for sulfatase activity